MKEYKAILYSKKMHRVLPKEVNIKCNSYSASKGNPKSVHMISAYKITMGIYLSHPKFDPVTTYFVVTEIYAVGVYKSHS